MVLAVTFTLASLLSPLLASSVVYQCTTISLSLSVCYFLPSSFYFLVIQYLTDISQNFLDLIASPRKVCDGI